MKSLEDDARYTFHAVLDSKTPSVSFEQTWERYKNQPQSPGGKVTRKVILGIGIPSVIILGSGAAVLASSVLSTYTDNVKTASQAQGVFEYVNGTAVSNKDFQSFKAAEELIAELNHQSLSETEIVQKFNQEQVLYQEAQKERIMVSDQQASDYALKMKHMFEHPPGIADKTNLAQIEQVVKAQEDGLGVTDNEYWTQVAPKGYKVGLTIGVLKQHFFSTYQTAHHDTQYADILAAWNQYGQELLTEASIQNTRP